MMQQKSFIENRWKRHIDTQLQIPFSEKEITYNQKITKNIQDIFLNNRIADMKDKKMFADKINYNNPHLCIERINGSTFKVIQHYSLQLLENNQIVLQAGLPSQ